MFYSGKKFKSVVFPGVSAIVFLFPVGGKFISGAGTGTSGEDIPVSEILSRGTWGTAIIFGADLKITSMKILARSFLFFGLACLSCGRTGEVKDHREMVVHVAKTFAEPERGTKEYSFITRPFRSSELSFRVGGPIDNFEVYVGNYYKKGELIAKIDDRDFKINKERAEAVYLQAKSEYERIKTLYEKNNISASAHEKMRADYVAAKMAFETASNKLEDTRLVAPFDGYVGEVYIEKFQDVKASQPVITFIDIHQLKIEAYVTQDVAFHFRDNEVRLRFDAMPDSLYRARVAEVSKGTTRNNLSYLLTALLPNKGGELLSGMSGKLLMDSPGNGSGTRVTVPQTALCHRPAEGDYVWTMNPATNTVERKPVLTADLLPDGRVVVTSGLEKDEIVVTSGLRFLSEGMSVKITDKQIL